MGLGYELETKAQSSQWKSPGYPCPQKVQQSHSKIKTMLTVVFDWEGVVNHRYTPPGQTINKEYYLSVLSWLRDAVWRKQPQLWAICDWQLLHNNVPTHSSHLVQFGAKHQITQVTQPQYSPDLALCDFWLFPKLKSPLKGKRFQTINEIQENTMGQLMAIPTKDFANCFEQCWERSQGAYFKGDGGIIVLYTMFLVYCIFFNKGLYFSQYMAGHLLDRPRHIAMVILHHRQNSETLNN